MDILCSTILNEKDNVVLEDPTFLEDLQIFHLYNSKIQRIKLAKNGIKTDKPKKQLKNIIKKYSTL